MKNILVTGGFGFLGSHLLEVLLSSPENHIHVVDNLSTNVVDPAEFSRSSGERLTYDAVSVEEFFTKTARPKQFSEIYHLASVVGPVGVLRHAGNIVRSVVRDTYLLIDYCLATKAKLLDVSTSEVYGGGKEGFCSEDFDKIVPANTTIRLEYAVGKLAAETALINTQRTRDLWTVIIRPFNISGKRQRPGGGFVLPRFVSQALKGEPLTVYGDGSQIRAFTHAHDISTGIEAAMALGRPGEAYNLGNPNNRVTILELAQKVIKISGSSSQIQFVDPVKLHGQLFAEAANKFPNSTKAQKELNWRFDIGIDEIVEEAVEEWKGILGSAKKPSSGKTHSR
ncbi:MAG TPA: NAD-dependent epimerase/dehydratase family protein [Verrucomicrobiae bacterium]|nr:NAD-dependent epimerase/dehydratase family protein [Verrucomicrobiae bacterium]